jgi:hypothetical protein
VNGLAGKEKVEQDYKGFEDTVEELAKAELEKIKRKAAELKQEAEKVGAAVEASIGESEASAGKKKS